MIEDKEILFTLALSLVRGIGDKNIKGLIGSYKGAESAFQNLTHDLFSKTNDLRNINIAQALEIAKVELDYIKQNDINLLRFDQPEYPYYLKQTNDSPLFLMTRGNFDFRSSNKYISVVGSRMMTTYGKSFVCRLVDDLATYNPVIVSGLAYGVDIEAHRNALSNQLQTIAVLAHGLDMIYPSLHKKEATRIMESGLLISEHLSFRKADRENFPRRNRIIAGISRVSVIVEASDKGGALITANLANDYNREVFALPGRVGDFFSKGCNNLIAQNKATILNNPNQIVEFFNWTTNSRQSQSNYNITNIPEPGLKIVEQICQGVSNIDEIAINTGISTPQIRSILLDLELKNIVFAKSFNHYELK